MQRLAWPLRLVAIVLAGALLVAGTAIGVGPRLWAIANAHSEVPVALPSFQPLSQRTVVYDAKNKVIAQASGTLTRAGETLTLALQAP